MLSEQSQPARCPAGPRDAAVSHRPADVPHLLLQEKSAVPAPRALQRAHGKASPLGAPWHWHPAPALPSPCTPCTVHIPQAPARAAPCSAGPCVMGTLYHGHPAPHTSTAQTPTAPIWVQWQCRGWVTGPMGGIRGLCVCPSLFVGHVMLFGFLWLPISVLFCLLAQPQNGAGGTPRACGMGAGAAGFGGPVGCQLSCLAFRWSRKSAGGNVERSKARGGDTLPGFLLLTPTGGSGGRQWQGQFQQPSSVPQPCRQAGTWLWAPTH